MPWKISRLPPRVGTIMRQAATDATHDQPGDRWFWLLLAVVTSVELALLIYFIREDARSPTYDDAWYLENSLYLYHRLREGGLREFVAAYTEAMRIKPPLIAVLPIPFYSLFGPGVDSALLINAVFLLVANIYLFRLVQGWYGSATALLSVIIFQTFPVTIGMSRAFMTEFGLVALIISFLYYLVASDHFRLGSQNLKLGFVGGLGMLMKINFLLVAAPVLVAILYRARRKPSGESTAEANRVLEWYARHPVWSISATAALVAGSWYAFNLAEVVEFTLRYSIGSIGLYQAAGRDLWLWGAALVAISTYYAGAALLLGSLAIVYLVLGARFRLKESTMILLSWFLPGGAAAFVGSHGDYRYVLAVLPPVAIFIAVSVKHICEWLRPNRTIQAMTAAAFCTFPLYCYVALTFPLPAWPETLQVGKIPMFRRHLGWARPPDQYGDWGQDRIVAAARELSVGADKPANVIVGVEHPFFNANVLGYLNARDDGPLRFHSLGFDPDTPIEIALRSGQQRLQGLNPSVIVMAEGFKQEELQGFINRLNEHIKDMLVQRQLPFQRSTEIQLTPSVRAVLYRRL